MPLHKAAILFLGALSGFRYSPHLRRGSNMRSIRGAVAVVSQSARSFSEKAVRHFYYRLSILPMSNRKNFYAVDSGVIHTFDKSICYARTLPVFWNYHLHV